MKNERYIEKKFYSIASLTLCGGLCLSGARGLFRSIILIRDKETKIIEGFYGEIFLSEEDDIEAEMKKERVAIGMMLEKMKESETYKAGNLEFLNHSTGRWEQ